MNTPREALAIVVERRIDADRVFENLDRIVTARGADPAFIRMDNGPKLTANAVRGCCLTRGTDTSYIEPGGRGRTRSSSRPQPRA